MSVSSPLLSPRSRRPLRPCSRGRGPHRPAAIPSPRGARRFSRRRTARFQPSLSPSGAQPPGWRPGPDADPRRRAASPSPRTARTSFSSPELGSHAAPRIRDGRDRRPIARRGDKSPRRAKRPIRPPFGRRLLDSLRKPSPPRERTSWKIAQRRLALDLPDIHGPADLFFDLPRKCRPDCRDAGQVAGVRLLQVLQRLEAPLEQRPSADPPNAAERDQLEEFLLDAVLHLDREPRERADLLLVEDPAEFAHRVQEPLRLIRHPADVPRPNPEFLRDLFLRPLRDPVVEKRCRLDFRQEEVVVLDRERQVRFLDLLLDPAVIAAP